MVHFEAHINVDSNWHYKSWQGIHYTYLQNIWKLWQFGAFISGSSSDFEFSSLLLFWTDSNHLLRHLGNLSKIWSRYFSIPKSKAFAAVQFLLISFTMRFDDTYNHLWREYKWVVKFLHKKTSNVNIWKFPFLKFYL